VKAIEDLSKRELLAELEQAVGVDLLAERFTRREPTAILRGMVQRVRNRQDRRKHGLEVCVLVPPETCYVCRKMIRKARGKNEDNAQGFALMGEFVLVHKREDCLKVASAWPTRPWSG